MNTATEPVETTRVPITSLVGVDPRNLNFILSILHRIEDAPRNGRLNEVLRADAIAAARDLEGVLK